MKIYRDYSQLWRRLELKGQQLHQLVLDEKVVPVILLDSVIDQVDPGVLGDGLFTAGEQTAAAADFVHADTGALPIGLYAVDLHVYTNAAGATTWNLQLRNDANDANIVETNEICQAVDSFERHYTVRILSEDQRLRVTCENAMAAGIRSQALLGLVRIAP